jgi:aryl-alcohol dehydrogenase-like predicted oxidoreductase
MEYTELGRSNMRVSKICLGTMHFGPYASEEVSHQILDRCLELGINFIDTANVYGGAGYRGRSEEIIGNWFAKRPGVRDEVVLATKVYGTMTNEGTPNDAPGFSAYKVRKQAADSLRRLQTDRIDVYQVHHIDKRVSAEEFWGTYERLIADGDVLYAGSSNFSGWGLARAQMQAWARGSVGLVSEQTQYNLLSRYPELEVLPAAKEFGIGLIVYMPLAGGLLTGKVHATEGSRTRQLEGEYDMKLGAGNHQLTAFSTLCRELGEKEHVVATAWTLQHPAVASAIVGVRTVEQLDGLEQAASLRLEPAVMTQLDDIFDINKGRKLKLGPAPEAYAW